MNTADFDFHLPEELIAQTPLKNEMHLNSLSLIVETGGMQDKHFHSIIDMLEPGDALVMNDTRVLPARLMVKRGDRRARGAPCSKILPVMSGKFWLNLPNVSKLVLVSALAMVASAPSLRKN